VRPRFEPGDVASLVGSATVLSSQAYSERRKEATENKKKKAEKLEKFVTVVFEQACRVADIYRMIMQDSKESIPLTSTARIESIKLVYFTHFDPLVTMLGISANEFESLINGNSHTLKKT
jgi:hypothetical protein